MDNNEEKNTLELNIEEHIEPNYYQVIEGLLFVVGDMGLTIDELSNVLDCSKDIIVKTLDKMILDYDDVNKGISLVNYGNKYHFVSKKDIYPYIEKLFKTSKNNNLSQSALETLAIIAYKQPVTRVEIEEIRGVGSELMLKKLLSKELIQELGRSDAPGRPILYGVTEEFMDSFKLVSLDELPDLPDYTSDDGNELYEE